jgi:L-threonylcarbamoyladenylate synthase
VKILPASDDAIRKAAEIIRSGGLAAFPTETVYGLGADAFNRTALARVFQAKGRPRFDPLIIHIADLADLGRIADLAALPPSRREPLDRLAGAFWPGPLTLILPKRPEVPDLATSGLPTAAIRFPDHPVAQRLIRLSTGAVAAPSANPFGRLSPPRAEHVLEGLGDQVDCIIDGGPCRVGVESTVLDLATNGVRPRILRPGGISREQLEAVIGTVDMTEGGGPPRSPGQMKSHYAPVTPLRLHSADAMAALPRQDREGYLFFQADTRDTWLAAQGGHAAAEGRRPAEPDNKIPPDPADSQIRTLSETGSPLEAASRLFEVLHELDRLDLACIHAEALPPEGLGAAVNDRLSRAEGR